MTWTSLVDSPFAARSAASHLSENGAGGLGSFLNGRHSINQSVARCDWGRTWILRLLHLYHSNHDLTRIADPVLNLLALGDLIWSV